MSSRASLAAEHAGHRDELCSAWVVDRRCQGFINGVQEAAAILVFRLITVVVIIPIANRTTRKSEQHFVDTPPQGHRWLRATSPAQWYFKALGCRLSASCSRRGRRKLKCSRCGDHLRRRVVVAADACARPITRVAPGREWRHVSSLSGDCAGLNGAQFVPATDDSTAPDRRQSWRNRRRGLPVRDLSKLVWHCPPPQKLLVN